MVDDPLAFFFKLFYCVLKIQRFNMCLLQITVGDLPLPQQSGFRIALNFLRAVLVLYSFIFDGCGFESSFFCFLLSENCLLFNFCDALS